jgi:geranylgeranyl diphosphate synthase type I
MSELPAVLTAIAPAVEARIRQLLDTEAKRWGELAGELLEPMATLSDFVLGGGKRLRPAFCYWAFVGAGGDPEDPRVVDAGAALEMLHTFALLHDDVMDGSDRRRGRPTVHLQYADRHREAGWRGDGTRFGQGVAILVGDLAFVYSDLLMREAPPEAAELYTELRVELNIGQYLDLIGTAEAPFDRATARRIALYKSGKYSVERPLHLGAALAGRLTDLGPGLSAYGLAVGEAFQARDDLLGAFGDTAVTGKPVGDDLREGKATPLLANAYAHADGRPDRLLERVGSPDITDEEVAALQAFLVDSGARDRTEAEVERLVAQAIDVVEEIDILPEARKALTELAIYVGRRDR